MASGGLRCECGALIGDGASCHDVYHLILAAEQLDPQLWRWHTVVVCAFLLQHPSRSKDAFLDGQFRMLQLYRAEGIDALLRVTTHQRERNRHAARAGYDFAPLQPYASLPASGPPATYAQGFLDMHDLVGSLGRDGYREYERRLDAIVDATIAAWLGRNVAETRRK